MDRASGVGPVRNWMTRAPVSVTPQTPVAEVTRLMRSEGIRHVVVVDGGHLVGIVSDRDVRGAARDATAAAIMTEIVLTVAPETPLTDAARALLERRIGALPVLDGDRVVGILSQADALEALLAYVERG